VYKSDDHASVPSSGEGPRENLLPAHKTAAVPFVKKLCRQEEAGGDRDFKKGGKKIAFRCFTARGKPLITKLMLGGRRMAEFTGE